jgi:hypothetical protein
MNRLLAPVLAVMNILALFQAVERALGMMGEPLRTSRPAECACKWKASNTGWRRQTVSPDGRWCAREKILPREGGLAVGRPFRAVATA